MLCSFSAGLKISSESSLLESFLNLERPFSQLYFFAMLGDLADYSEYKNGRRATGLVYSAGSFATKFGGVLLRRDYRAGLGRFSYDGMNEVAIKGAIPGIIMLMSWIPTVIALIAAGVMALYPLDQKKMDEITDELNNRRKAVVA